MLRVPIISAIRNGVIFAVHNLNKGVAGILNQGRQIEVVEKQVDN